MKKRISTLVFFCLCSLCLYANPIPILEVRINNSATGKDDYVGTEFIPCNIRLVNGVNYSGDIEISLRNIAFTSGGKVLFSADGLGTGTETLDIVANKDNTPTTFYIQGAPGYNSVMDKDAIIEVVDRRDGHNPVVLARKALMVVAGNPLPVSKPEIEIQINSESTLDDYVTWSPTPCRIRLVNGASFSSSIDVTLKNLDNSVGKVLFANNSLAYNSTATETTLPLTLPNSGTWVDFFISGAYGSPSLNDKDAIIEVIKAGTQTTTITPDSTSQGTPTPPAADSIVITRDTITSLRDTVISSTAVRSEEITDTVTLISIKGTVVRVRDTLITETKTIIPRNQDSIPPSSPPLNTVILPDSMVFTREALMVRVRKNANLVSISERQRFLNALVTLNNTFNEYQVFNQIHYEASNPEAHNGPGFLAWHRAFILTFERKLQTVDPGVSLLYWRFDLAGPNLFSMDFMGSKPTTTSDAFADFNASDPLIAWNMLGGPGIRRTTVFANSAPPPSVKASWLSETATLALGTNYNEFRAMESNPHNHAHDKAGGATGDWLKSVSTSLRDPLFFLLHGNVDRLWARWQWINNRFDPLVASSYSPQGSFPNSGTIHIGHYLNDTMWPWNGVTGTYTGIGTAALSDRPATAPGGPVPAALSLLSPVGTPRPLNMIDYKNNRSLNVVNNGMGFCYDDVPFQ